MRIAILADIHANLPALEAVLADIAQSGVTRFACLGDTVGYGPHPAACLDLVRGLQCPTVLGNHDFYVSTGSPMIDRILAEGRALTNPVWAGVRLARQQLDEDQLSWLRALPSSDRLEDAVIAHAALHDRENWPYLHALQDALPTLRLLDGRLGFFGHTHRENVFSDPEGLRPGQVDEQCFRLPADTSVAVTAGSTGRSRDLDRRARWLEWDNEARLITFHRVPYDHDATLAAAREAGLPV